ncbi:MAG: HD domain-containing protein [Candidatus Falkowbacteria bacterium]
MKTKFDFRPFINSLATKAFQSNSTRGRRHFRVYDDKVGREKLRVEDDDSAYFNVHDPFLMDRIKISFSKTWRRLADKTQVFVDHYENKHLRNRKIHTDEVAALGVQISSILGLNTYLVEASALGHDLGHSPFGHLGEKVISEIAGQPFKHEIMSVVIAQQIERGGRGLNLSFETLEGILHHSRGKNGLHVNANLPQEHNVVMLADKIAYTFSDLNDAVRCNYLSERNLPAEVAALGKNQRERWLNCLYYLIKESSEKGFVSFADSDVAQKFELIRQWSYTNLYYKLNDEGPRQQAVTDLNSVHHFLSDWPGNQIYDPLLIMALLTDQEAKKIAKFAQYPTIKDIGMLKSMSFMEILSRIPPNRPINIFEPDLNPENFSQ